jgi:hypothetical protein
MYHFLYCSAWLIGAIAVGAGSMLLINKLAKMSYRDYSCWQTRRTRHD